MLDYKDMSDEITFLNEINDYMDMIVQNFEVLINFFDKSQVEQILDELQL